MVRSGRFPAGSVARREPATAGQAERCRVSPGSCEGIMIARRCYPQAGNAATPGGQS